MIMRFTKLTDNVKEAMLRFCLEQETMNRYANEEEVKNIVESAFVVLHRMPAVSLPVVPVYRYHMYAGEQYTDEILPNSIKENGILYDEAIHLGTFMLDSYSADTEEATEYCRNYAKELHSCHDEDFPFIFSMHSEPYCVSAIERNFRDVMWKAGIPYGGELYGPRLHDLRHSFACHTLYRWVKTNEDLMTLLPILSKYLGHSGVMSTQWYLRLTAEFYPDVTEKVNSYTGCVFPEVGGELIEKAY